MDLAGAELRKTQLVSLIDGVVVWRFRNAGESVGGMTEFEEQKERLLTKGPDRVSPFLVPKMMPNAAAGYVSILHGLRGPCFCTVSFR